MSLAEFPVVSPFRRRLVPAVGFVLLAFPATAVAAENSETRSCSVVPFSLSGHLVIVQGTICDQKELSLVIDTGASRSVIDSQIARKLHLACKPKTVTVYGSRRKIDTATISAITVADRLFADVPVMVADLTLPGREHMVHIDGLIGLDLLRQMSLSIDYESKTVAFGRVVHSPVSCAYYDKLPFVPVFLDVGGRRLTLRLDTGAAHLVLYQNRAVGRVAVKATGEKREVQSLDGKLRLRGAEISDVKMDETHFDSLPAYLLDRRVSKGEPDGILGVAALGLRRLTLSDGIISWEK